MTLLVAALLFGVSGVAGVTVITLSALSYAKHVERTELEELQAEDRREDEKNRQVADEERCHALSTWTDANKHTFPYRCLLRARHSGPHRILDVRTGGAFWWKEKEDQKTKEGAS